MSKPQLKDFEGTLIREINAEHRHVILASKKTQEAVLETINAAIRCGLLLMKAKQDVRRHHGYGAWLVWIKDNIDVSAETVRLYIRLAKIKGAPITDLKEGISCLKDVMIECGALAAPNGHGPQNRVVLDAFFSRSVRFVGQWREAWSRELTTRPLEKWPTVERQQLKDQLEPLVLVYNSL